MPFLSQRLGPTCDAWSVYGPEWILPQVVDFYLVVDILFKLQNVCCVMAVLSRTAGGPVPSVDEIIIDMWPSLGQRSGPHVISGVNLTLNEDYL